MRSVKRVAQHTEEFAHESAQDADREPTCAPPRELSREVAQEAAYEPAREPERDSENQTGSDLAPTWALQTFWKGSVEESCEALWVPINRPCSSAGIQRDSAAIRPHASLNVFNRPLDHSERDRYLPELGLVADATKGLSPA